MQLRNGFTLIELLVVIAIIAMLLAVLVPSLRKAKEYAKNIICRTNCRSLALATNLYADDNEQKFFAYISGLFLNQLSPYIDNVDKVRYCPSTVIHFGITNIAFADGHSEPVELKHLWNLKWNRKFVPQGGGQTREDGTPIIQKDRLSQAAADMTVVR